MKKLTAQEIRERTSGVRIIDAFGDGLYSMAPYDKDGICLFTGKHIDDACCDDGSFYPIEGWTGNFIFSGTSLDGHVDVERKNASEYLQDIVSNQSNLIQAFVSMIKNYEDY